LQHLAEETNPHVMIPKSRYRILLVDDESDITLTFEQMLEGEGFKVDSFNDPQLALSNFTPGTYDVALIDTKMPKMLYFFMNFTRFLMHTYFQISICFTKLQRT
jgi:CheY-like chemotaxis protein